jgi:hypothetical protein
MAATHRITVYLEAEDKAAVEAAAKLKGKPASEWIRDLAKRNSKPKAR